MTQTLTTIGHRTAFNNEQSPYRIVSYKRPRYDNVKQFKRVNERPYSYKKMNENQICNVSTNDNHIRTIYKNQLKVLTRQMIKDTNTT